MIVVARPMASPALLRELPKDVIAIWPALVQQFERVSHSQLMSLRSCGSSSVQRRVEALEAAALLPSIEQALRDGSIDPVYLQLTAAAAHIKLGKASEARVFLRHFAATPALTASLRAPARAPHAQLIGAHPLWLVLHVAIEAGLGPSLVGDILDCGLRARLDLEPELAAGLLLNASKQGDAEIVVHLLQAGVALTPRARVRLAQAIDAFEAELRSRTERRVPMPALERQYLEQRRQALAALGEEESAKRLLTAAGLEQTKTEKRMCPTWHRFLPNAGRRSTQPMPQEPRSTAPQ